MSSPGSSAFIQVERMAYTFPRSSFSLQVHDFSVEAGESVALVGPSGSGKTTLLNLLSGTLLPEAGKVSVGDVDWVSLSEVSRRRRRASQIGQVFQEFELLEYLTVRENILLPFLLGGVSHPDETASTRLEHLVASVGLTELMHRKPTMLSHGERQRVAICRALVTAPGLLLADEPTASLDADNGKRVLKTLLDHGSTCGATLVVATHDQDLCGAFDRVVDCREFHGGATS